jgi:hypothetical protein
MTTKNPTLPQKLKQKTKTKIRKCRKEKQKKRKDKNIIKKTNKSTFF